MRDGTTVPSIWFVLNSMINHRRLSEGSCVGLVPCVQTSVGYVWTASTNEGATRHNSSSSSSSSSSRKVSVLVSKVCILKVKSNDSLGRVA